MRELFLICLILLGNNEFFAQVSVPYQNDFDQLPLDAVGWSHAATSGTDDWQIGAPSGGQYFNASFSPSNAWATNLSGPFAANSERSLITPYFNLTNTSVHYILSFQHKTNASGAPFSFKLEYKVGQSGGWQLLDNASAQKASWQNTSGFTPYYFAWIKPKIDLFFLQGQDSVQFRFKVLSSASSGYGWLLDDFEINERHNNLAAVQGDTIRGVNQYFTNFTVKSNYALNLEWVGLYSFTDKFYFSTDNVLDASDLLLGNVTHSASGSIPNWSNTFPLPPGLSAGNYYVFYQYDTGNALIENTESDNQNYAVLVLDSIYSANYVTDFDTTALIWNSLVGPLGSNWRKGDPNSWHLENPRSGENAWLSGVLDPAGNMNLLTSPFIDLSSSVNTTVCFWYRNSRHDQNPSFQVMLPTYNQPTITTPYLFYSQNVPRTRYYGWDCHCKSVPQYDGEVSTKFGFKAYGNASSIHLDKVLIDDVYIGSAKPDIGMGGERDNRFVSNTSVIDTLTYMLFNSGLQTLPVTTTEFYWSADSILDVSDLLLGSQQEPTISDTSFLFRTFQFSKPTSVPGEYFIIYKLDSGNLTDEMREYDNVGYFRTQITHSAVLPYFNDFETQIDGWRHASSLGTDIWEWTIPSGTVLNTAFSGQKALVTNTTGAAPLNSRSHLYTPVFNLSTMQNPVMEFDLLADFRGNNGYYSWLSNMGNIMYSIDGGNSWKILTPQNESYKRWYQGVSFQSIDGIDYRLISNTASGELLYGFDLSFFQTELTYQGRDYDENTHYVMDLDFLQGEKQVQFMFVYANSDALVEGMLLDNFEIKEAAVDLKVKSTKKLLVSAADHELKTYFDVKNDENYISDSTSIKLYLSVDSVLNAGDFLLQTQLLPEILPYEKHLVNVKVLTPSNYGQYNYLLYELDTQNENAESNETNNLGFLDLAMDSASNYEFPILFDFNGNEVDGWTWWHDSTGTYKGHRFRHKLVTEDYLNFPEDGVWFLDAVDLVNYTSTVAAYPVHHLEPPAFDFSELSTIEMEFDYRTSLTDGGFSEPQGGNLSYSIDGGVTWIVLGYSQDPYAQNWYTSTNFINGESSWGNKPNWTHAKYNLSFLGGQPNVRFRFNWRGKFVSSSSSMHGFRLDNFKIDGKFLDLVASDNHPFIEINTITQPGFQINYEISNIGDSSVMTSKTNFYWSTDTILDANDQLLYEVDESIFFANSVNISTQNIYYPIPLTLNEYYVLYLTDADSIVHESNETNNLSWIKIGILDTLYVDLVSVPLISPVFTSVASNWFYFEFEYRNDGSLTADSSKVLVHWSQDTLLDASDVLLYTIQEPELSGLSHITNAGNVYFPHPVVQSPYYLLISTDVSDEVPESNESNNFVWVRINLDSTGLGLDQLEEDLRFLLVSGDGYIQLNYLGEEEGITQVSLINSIGQVLHQESEMISKNSPMKIDTTSLSSGIYFLNITKASKVQSIKFFNHANR